MSNLIFPLAIVAGIYFISKSKPASVVSAPTITEKTNFKVALFKSLGVSKASFDASKELLSKTQNIELHIVTAEEIRKNILEGMDVVIFGGGSGSQQAKDLQPEGIAKVKTYVKNGGNYIGICGGSYLALQSTEQYKKLDLVASRNYGDHWQRGAGTCEISTNDGKKIPLHFENGPIFDDEVKVKGLEPFRVLGAFGCDFYKKGKQPGQMPGRPAIIISSYGKGRVLLFSPNPLIGGQETYYPELILNGIHWIVNHRSIPKNIKFTEVFG